jgi:Domain of unknown function (DUF4397)
VPGRHLARPVAAPRRRAAAAGSGVVALLLLVVGLALAPATASAAAATSMLRIAQLDPDQGNLELTVSSVADPNQKVLIASLGYGELSDYRNVEAGDYVIATRKAGSTEPPMVAKTVSVQAGTTTTVATVGAEGGVTTFTDDLSAPDPTQARVRVINAAAPQLDVRGPAGEDIASGLARGAAGPYATLAPGETRLSVTPAGAPAAELPVTLGANEVSSIVLTSSDGALRARVVVDAGGPPVVPPGPVHAGFGGAAAEQNPYRAAGSAVLVVLAAAAALVSARLARSR